MDYDPNLTMCGRMAVQTVRLTFGVWKYRKTIEVDVKGNCRGLSAIDAAVAFALETLPYITSKYGDHATIILLDPDGRELCCEDEEPEYQDWLKEMLLSAEIIAIRPQTKEDEATPPPQS